VKAGMTTAGAHIRWVHDARFPPRAGNLVRPLIDGLPAFRRICEVVEAARHSVFVTVAFIHPSFELPDGRGSFFDLLAALEDPEIVAHLELALRRGVIASANARHDADWQGNVFAFAPSE
jgi:hypothetical protein